MALFFIGLTRMRNRATLLTRFTLVSLSVTVLIAVGFSWMLSREMTRDAINHAAQDAAQMVETSVTPGVAPEDFATPTRSRVAAWERRIGHVVGSAGIVRVKVWNTRGQIVYSDDRGLIGRVYPLEEEDELREAVGGRLVTGLSGLEKSENVGERTYGRLLEVYVPVIPRGRTDVTGVYEVYRNFAPVEARTRAIQRLIWGGSAVAFGLLYAALFILVSTASRQLSRRLQRLEALRSIDAAITASLDLRVTLNIFLDQLTTQLRVDAADILLLRPHTQTLEYAAGHGFRTAALQDGRLRVGEGHVGRSVIDRKRMRIPSLPDEMGDSTRAPLLVAEGFIAYFVAPLIVKGQVKGVLEVLHRGSLDPDLEWLGFLDALVAQAAIAIDNATMFEEVQRANAELTLAYDATLEGWVRALDLRHNETEGHTQRVTALTVELARTMGIAEEELVYIRRGALLHDIGKIGIPDAILLKPGPLSKKEWEVMRRHPVYAYELISPISYLRSALDVVYPHHEKWDGTGYPRGLKGEEIPLAARIFAVADVWDALRSDRPYRAAWPDEKVLKYIREQTGKHFDPKVVEVFLKLKGQQLVASSA